MLQEKSKSHVLRHVPVRTETDGRKDKEHRKREADPQYPQ